MRTIALIPARSGSKGVVDKNIQQINGKSLIQHAIDYALDKSWIDDVYISTDSRSYELHAIENGAKSLGLRNTELSSDSARSLDVCKNFIQECKKTATEIDFLVLLQPTSPIRPNVTEHDIDMALINEGFKTITAVAKVEEPHPYKMLTLSQNGVIEPLFAFEYLGVPRQALPTCFMLTGSLYIWECNALLKSNDNFPMPVHYIEQNNFVNIDTCEDMEMAKKLVE